MERLDDRKNEDISSLVEKIKSGDREAFMTVISLYQKRIFLLAFSFFHNREDALDIVQDTFLRLHQKIHSFRKGENFQNWLFQIAKNLCIDYYRKNHSKRKEWGIEKDVDEINSSLQSKHDSNLSSDLREIFSQCLKKLAERQRMVFVLKHYNQLKYKEIAQVMKIAPGTAKSLHFKAIQNLRGLVSPYLGERYEGV
jgi:RNA polymerase sigma-70 factor (ECF subfamily)